MCAQRQQLLQRNIEQRLGGVRQHNDAREILMLSGMMRIRRQTGGQMGSIAAYG
jgi:hypothetical protein